jgi:fibronectin type 3 domain-containing protein
VANGSPTYANVSSPYVDTTSVANGTTYYYVVTGSNTGGEGSASNEANATPQVPVPTAPAGVSAAPGDGKVTISWNPVSGATSYKVYYNAEPLVSLGGITNIPGTSPQDVTGLTNDTPYYFRVTASNAGGEGPASAQVTETPVGPAPAPTGVTAVATDENDTANNTVVTLNWNASTDADHYKVYWRTTPGIPNDGAGANSIVLGNVLTYPHTDRTNGVRYYYRVAAVNGVGAETLSTEVSAKYACKWGSTEAQGMNWGTGRWKPAADCP